MFGRIAIPLISSATVIGLWTGAPRISRAHLAPQQNDSYTRKALETADEGMKIAQVGNGVAPQLTTDKHAMTVIGQGQAAAPADKALLEFRLGSREPAEQPPGAAVPTPQEEDLLTKAALMPVVDALVAINVPTGNIEVQTSAENPKMLVRFNKPTREQMQQVVTVASNALQKSNKLFLQGVGAEYGVNDCQPLEREARRLAISDAQVQVTSVALELGVKVGEMLFVTVYPSFGPANVSACGSKAAVPVSPLSLSGESIPPYNPSAPVEVQVRSQVSITYAIK